MFSIGRFKTRGGKYHTFALDHCQWSNTVISFSPLWSSALCEAPEMLCWYPSTVALQENGNIENSKKTSEIARVLYKTISDRVDPMRLRFQPRRVRNSMGNTSTKLATVVLYLNDHILRADLISEYSIWNDFLFVHLLGNLQLQFVWKRKRSRRRPIEMEMTYNLHSFCGVIRYEYSWR